MVKSPGSKLKQVADPDQGVVWRVQKYLWVTLFLVVAATMSLSLFAPDILTSYIGLWIYPAGFIVFLAVFNILATVYHRLEGHAKRTPHSLAATIALLITAGAGAGILYVDIPGLEYYPMLLSAITSLIAASYIYEDFEYYSALLPGLMLVMFLVSSLL